MYTTTSVTVDYYSYYYASTPLLSVTHTHTPQREYTKRESVCQK
jgi:hypothetical protein